MASLSGNLFRFTLLTLLLSFYLEYSHAFREQNEMKPGGGDVSKFCDPCKSIAKICKKSKGKPSGSGKRRLNTDAKIVENNASAIINFQLSGNLKLDYEVPTLTHQLKTDNQLILMNGSCTWFHLPHTMYIRSLEIFHPTEMRNELYHITVMACNDLKEGYTVNHDYIPCTFEMPCKEKIRFYHETIGGHYVYSKDGHGQVFNLPENVKFFVGPQSMYRYLGVTLHGSDSNKLQRSEELEETMKNIGVQVVADSVPPKFYMGMITAKKWFKGEWERTIPPNSERFRISSTCIPTDFEKLHVFSYFVHGHRFATFTKVNIHSPSTNQTKEILNYQHPVTIKKNQLFANEVILGAGDIIIMTCEYNTWGMTEGVRFGSNSNEEMCMIKLNFYMESSESSDHYVLCGDEVLTDKEIADIIDPLSKHD